MDGWLGDWEEGATNKNRVHSATIAFQTIETIEWPHLWPIGGDAVLQLDVMFYDNKNRSLATYNDAFLNRRFRKCFYFCKDTGIFTALRELTMDPIACM